MYIYKQLYSCKHSGFTDDLGELLDLGFSGHVHVLVSNADNHATQDGGIRLWVRRKHENTKH